LIKIDTLF